MGSGSSDYQGLQPGMQQRAGYLDLMRGFTMLLVIYSHLCLHLLPAESQLNAVFLRFRMPVFFFVSGFLAATIEWTPEKLQRRLRNRIRKQLIPTIIVLFLYATLIYLLRDMELKHSWYRIPAGMNHADFVGYKFSTPFKGGYWFTLALFQVSLIYIVSAWCLSRLRLSATKQTFVYLAAGLSCALLWYTWGATAGNHSGAIQKIAETICYPAAGKFYLFFFLGVVARLQLRHFLKGVGHPAAVWLFIVLFGASCFLPFDYTWDAAIGMCGILMMLSLFIRISRYIKEGNYLYTALATTGRNTLPIYLYHYFFILLIAALPTATISEIAALGSLQEFIILFVIATAIAAGCLIIEKILTFIRRHLNLKH